MRRPFRPVIASGAVNLTRPRAGATLLAAASLVALTSLAYLPISGNDFLLWDDDALILENPLVAAPLGLDTLVGAFRLGGSSYWQPVTVLSFAVDHAIFGYDPVAFHLENVAWHAAAALVLFAALLEATGTLGRSFVAAALFAVHPINVESVAWAVERRNVLAAFFGLLAVLCHVRAVRGRRGIWHAAAVASAAVSLLAKALLLPLPVLLLALDVWPLKRFGVVPLRRLIVEKLPLASLCAAVAVVVSLSLTPFRGGAQPALSLRLANAAVALVRQLAHIAVPVGLSPFYEYPRAIPAWQVGGALLVLAGLAAAAWRLRERAPYLLAGGGWFAAALAPTLGLVQAGAWPALADRHAYVAAIGVLVATTWGLAALLSSRPAARMALAVVAIGAVAALTSLRVPLWRDTVTVLRRAVQTAPTSAHVHYALGTALVRASPPQLGEGIEHLELAVRLDPSDHLARENLGIALGQAGLTDRAIEILAAAIRLAPGSARAHAGLGKLLLDAQRYDEAAASLRRALELAPGDREAYTNLGVALNRSGRFDESIAHLSASPELLRRSPEARFNLGVAQAATGRVSEALREAQALRAVAPQLAASLEAFIGSVGPPASR